MMVECTVFVVHGIESEVWMRFCWWGILNCFCNQHSLITNINTLLLNSHLILIETFKRASRFIMCSVTEMNAGYRIYVISIYKRDSYPILERKLDDRCKQFFEKPL